MNYCFENPTVRRDVCHLLLDIRFYSTAFSSVGDPKQTGVSDVPLSAD
jgi:hypothetical protein